MKGGRKFFSMSFWLCLFNPPASKIMQLPSSFSNCLPGPYHLLFCSVSFIKCLAIETVEGVRWLWRVTVSVEKWPEPPADSKHGVSSRIGGSDCAEAFDNSLMTPLCCNPCRPSLNNCVTVRASDLTVQRERSCSVFVLAGATSSRLPQRPH